MSLGNRFSQHSFAQVPSANIQRSRFDRSFAVKDTFDFDQLVPCFVDEILPGDTVNLNMKHFVRLATQQVPVLDNMYLDFFFFFVPNRLVWDNWEKFNGAQDSPGASTDYLIPQIETASKLDVGTIYDKMGLPTDVTPTNPSTLNFNALPFRAYNLIFNEWFRDQNLQNPVNVPKGDGPDALSTYAINGFAKKHDYFTSCLPWPQKGDAVTLSLANSAPVISDDTVPLLYNAADPTNRQMSINGSASVNVATTPSGGGLASWGTNTGLEADLTAASAVTINQLRLAIMTQSLLELDARGGTRYVEILKSHFNVISPDFRLQRPEFLSSSTVRLNQHPVAQTSESTENSPQANLAAYTTSANMGNNVGFTKSFVEHGYVIGLVRARADVTYQQGINKMWLRQTRYDFFWPKLQELGEQAVLNRELVYTGVDSVDDLVFGYQERYAEYRYLPSQIRGQFRSTYSESLDVWHLAQEFSGFQNLNSAFILNNTPIERVLAVTEGYPHLLADYWFDYKHARPMVTYGVPATLGRF